jgi:hypothetical protein
LEYQDWRFDMDATATGALNDRFDKWPSHETAVSGGTRRLKEISKKASNPDAAQQPSWAEGGPTLNCTLYPSIGMPQPESSGLPRTLAVAEELAEAARPGPVG